MGFDVQSTNGRITIATTRLPIVDMTFRGGLTVDEYRQGLDGLVRIFQTRLPPFLLLLDMREFNPFRVTPKMREEGAAVWSQNRELYLRVVVAEARVVLNPLARGMLTAFDWLTNAGKWPCRQFSNMTDAEAWLQHELDARPPKTIPT